MKLILLAILLNTLVLADHYGLPHDIANDEDAAIEEDEGSDDDIGDAIYEAILDEYYLPWEDDIQTEEVPDEVLLNTTEVDPDFIYVQGDGVVIDSQGNAYSSGNQSGSL